MFLQLKKNLVLSNKTWYKHSSAP